MKPYLIAAAVALAVLAGCKHRPADIPKRYAYPRVTAPDSARMAHTVDGLTLELSADAEVSRPAEQWLDASYPALGATLHLAARRTTDQENLLQELANRRQRISLNLGSATARADRFTTAQGFDCELVVSAEGVSTPVQFIACDPDGRLLTGAVALSGATAPADSLQPIVKALEQEVFSMLNSLANEQQSH